jgi:hypothetical protein
MLQAIRALTNPAAPCLRQINPTGKFSFSPSGKSPLGLPPSVEMILKELNQVVQIF